MLKNLQFSILLCVCCSIYCHPCRFAVSSFLYREGDCGDQALVRDRDGACFASLWIIMPRNWHTGVPVFGPLKVFFGNLQIVNSEQEFTIVAIKGVDVLSVTS